MKTHLFDLHLEDQPEDVDFHPTENLLASALINGKLVVHSYTHQDTPSAQQKFSVKAHDKDHPCRCVCFSLDGRLVITGSLDQSILAVDVATGQAKARKKDAHDAPITRLLAVSETLIASGDDDGVLKIWDSRQSDAVASLEPHTDYIADMTLSGDAARSSLVSVSGDGTLSMTDLRAKKVKATSEQDADDELLSVAAIKGGKKLVCGTTSGVLNIWSWGYWNDCSDRFPGHPESVTSLIKYDDDTLITGSSDGLIRILGIQPNKMLGTLGDHGDDLDIERLAITADRTVLASVSHDDVVKLWDLSILSDEGDDEEEEDDDEKKEQPEKEESEEEDSDSDDDGGKKKRKKGKNKGQHKIQSKKQAKSNNFFDGLL